MDVFGLRLSVLMFIENTLARITNEHAIIWSIWKMRSVELEALFRVRVRAAKTALSDLYLLALKMIRNILASIINALLIFDFFKDNLSETIRYIGLKFSQITKIVMLFRFSESILIAWSENESIC